MYALYFASLCSASVYVVARRQWPWMMKDEVSLEMFRNQPYRFGLNSALHILPFSSMLAVTGVCTSFLVIIHVDAWQKNFNESHFHPSHWFPTLYFAPMFIGLGCMATLPLAVVTLPMVLIVLNVH